MCRVYHPSPMDDTEHSFGGSGLHIFVSLHWVGIQQPIFCGTEMNVTYQALCVTPVYKYWLLYSIKRIGMRDGGAKKLCRQVRAVRWSTGFTRHSTRFQHLRLYPYWVAPSHRCSHTHTPVCSLRGRPGSCQRRSPGRNRRKIPISPLTQNTSTTRRPGAKVTDSHR